MATSTVVYTTARTRFTISRRAFATDTINVYYATNTTSPAPADVMTGAVLVDPSAYTLEGVGARANTFVVNWPAAPTSGTLIVEAISDVDRISTFPDNQLPSGAALNAEFDHVITLIDDVIGTATPGYSLGDAEDEIDALDVRLTTAEGDIAALDGRLTTAEGDIDALEAWRSGTVDPTLTSHGGRLTAVEGRATALEGRATDLENNALLESGGVFQAEGKRIANAADPVSAQDVATANYVDAQIAAVVVGGGAVPPPGAGFAGKVLTALSTSTYGWELPAGDADSDWYVLGVLADAPTGAQVPGVELTLDAGTYFVEGEVGYVVDVTDPATWGVAVYVADDVMPSTYSTGANEIGSIPLAAAGLSTTMKAVGVLRVSGVLALIATTTLKLCYGNIASAGTAKALGTAQLPARLAALRIK